VENFETHRRAHCGQSNSGLSNCEWQKVDWVG
jgi:hypothetical protein